MGWSQEHVKGGGSQCYFSGSGHGVLGGARCERSLKEEVTGLTDTLREEWGTSMGHEFPSLSNSVEVGAFEWVIEEKRCAGERRGVPLEIGGNLSICKRPHRHLETGSWSLREQWRVKTHSWELAEIPQGAWSLRQQRAIDRGKRDQRQGDKKR